MFKTLRDAFKVKEIRMGLLFTFFVLIVIRFGSLIPVPGLNTVAIKEYLESALGDANSFLSSFTGGSFTQMSIFALNVTPYITSSIIIQLLTIAIPALEEMQKDGEDGRKKITAITRYVTIFLAVIESLGLVIGFDRGHYMTVTGPLGYLLVIITLTTGSAFVMWLGERVTEKGVGNGISIILFAGIVANMPTLFTHLVNYFIDACKYPGASWRYFILAPVFLLIFLGLLWVISFMNDAERRIPIQYAKRVVGRKMYQGQSTHIPIKVGVSGVLPVIFASSILSIPSTIQIFLGDSVKTGFWKGFFDAFTTGGWIYCIIFAILIILFAFFYVTIQYNPVEIANNLRQNNGSIPGIRPGKPTSDYIAKILSKITLIGALFLAVIALVPMIYTSASGMHELTMGGTSIIILVGVALETIKQMESQMQMRNYKGFLD